jgi:hypothetical protein
MYRMKRIVAIVLLLLMVGAGAPQVFANSGPTETPGYATPLSGPTETPGLTGTTRTSETEGPTETPGYFELMLTYLVTTLIP